MHRQHVDAGPPGVEGRRAREGRRSRAAGDERLPTGHGLAQPGLVPALVKAGEAVHGEPHEIHPGRHVGGRRGPGLPGAGPVGPAARLACPTISRTCRRAAQPVGKCVQLQRQLQGVERTARPEARRRRLVQRGERRRERLLTVVAGVAGDVGYGPLRLHERAGGLGEPSARCVRMHGHARRLAEQAMQMELRVAGSARNGVQVEPPAPVRLDTRHRPLHRAQVLRLHASLPSSLSARMLH